MTRLSIAALTAIVTAFVACGPPPAALEVTLSNDTFATSGGNLFNCTSPEFPPNRHALSNTTLECTPPESGGKFTGATQTVSLQYGCGDGHGAMIFATCGGDESGAMNGSVTLALTANCNADSADAGVSQTFSFTGLGLGATQSSTLQACATFGNVCPTSNACGFNQFGATVNLGRKDPAR